MLKYLQEYTMTVGFTDPRLFYGGSLIRARSVTVIRGDRVLILDKLGPADATTSEDEQSWLGQLITNDNRNGKKIKVYATEVLLEAAESQTVACPPQVHSYINLADSILRQEDVYP